jgi:hypothetical protein
MFKIAKKKKAKSRVQASVNSDPRPSAQECRKLTQKLSA